MGYSSFQMERLLARVRRATGWLNWPAHRRWEGADRVQVSREAEAQAAAVAAENARAAEAQALPTQAVPGDVRDRTTRPALVEQERERRAGSFMEPPYPAEPPADRVPKRPRGAGRRPARPLAEGD